MVKWKGAPPNVICNLQNKRLLLFFGKKFEPTNISASGHAFFLLDLAVGKSLHQSPIQVADFGIFYRHSVKYAVVGVDYSVATRYGSIFGIVTKLIHYFCKLLDLLLMSGEIGILSA